MRERKTRDTGLLLMLSKQSIWINAQAQGKNIRTETETLPPIFIFLNIFFIYVFDDQSKYWNVWRAVRFLIALDTDLHFLVFWRFEMTTAEKQLLKRKIKRIGTDGGRALFFTRGVAAFLIPLFIWFFFFFFFLVSVIGICIQRRGWMRKTSFYVWPDGRRHL